MHRESADLHRISSQNANGLGRREFLFTAILSLVVIFHGFHAAHAQGLPASVTGIVSDPSGAVIPGAQVMLQQEGTSAVRRTVTNADGYFSIVGVPAGSLHTSH